MRTNIIIDEDLMAQAMKAGPYKTKKDAVEAGLKLLARQAAYREILKWRGKLRWEGDDSVDWTAPPIAPAAPAVRPAARRLASATQAAEVREPAAEYKVNKVSKRRARR
jgi:antitoxin ParD1/3/4